MDLIDAAPNERETLDLSDVTVMDNEIRAQLEGFSNEYLEK